jgi:hypothetical protein
MHCNYTHHSTAHGACGLSSLMPCIEGLTVLNHCFPLNAYPLGTEMTACSTKLTTSTMYKNYLVLFKALMK